MYTKDLTFLLRLLQSSKQSGILLVEAPGGAQQGLSWQGQFQLENGTVKSCMVLDMKNRLVLFSNDEAVNWLISQGRLEWRIEENAQSTSPLPPSPPQLERPRAERQPSGEMTPFSPLWEKRRREIFQRTQRGNNALVNAFPSRDHRQVFALVDGRRSIEEIVMLLHRPPEVILRLLQELYMGGFIL